jgi:hypothetical protein
MLTRRGLLASGGAAGAAAFAALNPGVASAITAIGQDPAYLRRSGYVRLVGQDFAAGSFGRSVTLTLAEVDDVAKPAGRDDAFSLLFVGPAGLVGGTRTLSHPSLGSFQMMVGPVDPAGRSQDYEAIVDRSHGLSRRSAPRPHKHPAPRPGGHDHGPKLVSHAHLRQGSHGVRCELTLDEHLHPRRAHASLLRDGETVAISGTERVHDHHVVLRLTRGRLRRGRYELVVFAGEHVQRLPVNLP